ncbi:MAG: ferritin-like domain-containing protein [Stigonema ocellatum SAG 48.90 = DSM 106950]|nr:ferritin-like domain-containing protein [Stigonema ocellatum SAG 48.90 = DSM 106950]
MPTFVTSSAADLENDLEILNNALYFEHQGIWAYDFAAGKLSNTDVGQAVLALALENQADHKQHRHTLALAVRDLGGTPVQPESSYDLSSYLDKGEGNLDSDVNIAKLALALETDAAIAYVTEASKLRIPSLIAVSAGIGSIESIHAARIRAAFNSLGVKIPVVPSTIMSAENRDLWILKV